MRLRLPPLLVPCLVSLWACTAPPAHERGAWDALHLAPGSEALAGRPLAELWLDPGTPREDVPLTSGVWREVARAVRPSVVSVYTRTLSRDGGAPRARQLADGGVLRGEALGSAFFVHGRGLLLTNHHVVADGRPLEALTVDGEELRLRVLAGDPVFDLALLEVVGSAGPWPALPVGDSETLAAGDMVLALGNPLGLGQSVSGGVVSQTHRRLTLGEGGRAPRFLQTDCAINLGSSGGPLVTLDGAWVGVNTAVAAGSSGIGFSVPSAQVGEFLRSITAGGAPPGP